MYFFISSNPLKLDSQNVLLLNRKSYVGSRLVILPCLNYLWNVGFVVFTPFHIMLILSKYRFKFELDMGIVLLYNSNS